MILYRVFFASMVLSLVFTKGVFAQTEDITVIENAIREKRENLSGVNERIEALEKELTTIQKHARTLETQMAVLENRLAKIELDIEATELKKSTLTDELTLIEEEIELLRERGEGEKASLRATLRAIQASDKQSRLFLLVQTKTFSEFFERVRHYEELNRRLAETLEETKTLTSETESYKEEREERLGQAQKLAEDLDVQKGSLAREEIAKQSLITATRDSESEYQGLIAELAREQNAIEREIASLQDDIEARLRGQDGGELGGKFSWPLPISSRRITTTFRDPSYPFRRLFEHSGLDIATPQGSDVYAAAPGVVAWTRQGRLYGNYLMIIHTDGMATLYAHLSGFEVVADQFVSRGQVIAKSGGARGTRGAGLSTGPHLHFEIRKGGIPIDPWPLIAAP
ncbi:peptidoglycan DD-metalloendopeptidase family protein [Candidatus Uhrbacteria bacterium]|nr:peptidoglycan DD-metalloendopeptidase family protein [Candidatus Uhrbacteria bacterium]